MDPSVPPLQRLQQGLRRRTALARLAVQRRLLRKRIGRLVLEHLDGVPVVVLPEVFNPAVFRSSPPLAAAVPPAPDGATALEVGCGSGYVSIIAVQRGYRVTAVDINPEAVRCTRLNALLNRVEDRLEVVESDLFAAVAGRRFDLVLFNPPFYVGRPQPGRDQAWRSDDLLGRFAAGLDGVLAPGGQALLVFSSHGATALLLGELAAHRWQVAVAAEVVHELEVVTVYRLTRPGD
ncbi:MAG: methyltransferase [Fimbriimonadaceae bacterium]|nr:methyltransferase [Fimbriimonadaceae bacterium]